MVIQVLLVYICPVTSETKYMTNDTQKLVIEELAKEFIALPPVDDEIKMKAALHFMISYRTVYRYLKGEIGKKNLAKALLAYLKAELETA